MLTGRLEKLRQWPRKPVTKTRDKKIDLTGQDHRVRSR